jgi:hypothetical protein
VMVYVNVFTILNVEKDQSVNNGWDTMRITSRMEVVPFGIFMEINIQVIG